MINLQKFFSALGLAQKAGKLASGDTAVQTAVKSGKAVIILLASDAAENSKRSITNLAKSNEVPLYECVSRREMGSAIGKAERTAIAVLDRGFAGMIKRQIVVVDK